MLGGSHVAKDQRAEIAPSPNTATLFIVRDTFFGGAVVFWNYLDGKMIGKTKGNSYFMAKIAPGPHYVVVTTENTAVANINFEAGKVYVLRESVIMGIWRARTSGFSPLSQKEANEAIKGCTYYELNPDAKPEDMDGAAYKKAIEEYQAELKSNSDGFKAVLEYKGF